MTDEQDIQAAVEVATSEEEFDALAFFSGSALPEDTVTVYADADTAYKLATIKQKYDESKEQEESEGLGITDEVFYVDEDEVEALQRKLKASAVVFKLRGLAPAAKDAIEKHARATFPYTEGAENTEYNESLNASLIASTIVNVSNVAGKVDKNKWDADRVVAFSKIAAESEFAKLYLGALKVNYIGDAIDQAISADFS